MNTRQVLDLLRRYESRNVTFIAPDGSWPIVWERARGVHVWDANGKKYLDLTGAFGVAAGGHANPRVVNAARQQMATLLHAMGDVHPHARKAELARELSRITFERWTATVNPPPTPPREGSVPRATSCQFPSWERSGVGLAAQRVSQQAHGARFLTAPATGKVIFCNSGFEAVEAALKTAMLATGKPGVIAFEGAYHGLGYGALNATHREHFRSRFRSQLGGFGFFVPFPPVDEETSPDPPLTPVRRGTALRASRALSPDPREVRGGMAESEKRIRRLFRDEKIGAVLIEPIQVRGGVNVPPAEFLPLLRRLCDEHGALLILDEIYTGLGRTGKWFACEHSGVIPDLICLGKGLTGGFPLSACIGRADFMDAAWPPSTGEAIHTSTFLGHPVGCAMALAQIREVESRKLIERSGRLGKYLLNELAVRCRPRSVLGACRGLGLLAGLELRSPEGSPQTAAALRIITAMLRRGFILLPEGEHANVISFTPPLTITERQLDSVIAALASILNHD